jgi:SAM-dependent methyltransferase
VTPTPVACRLCQENRLSCLGAIPDSDFFAGRVLEQPIPGGELWRCDTCGSMFRHPVLATETYSQLYMAGAADVWSAEGERNDLRVIRAQIAQRSGDQSVLDVGCSIGGFLLTLPASVRKFGVEPSTAAAAAARQAGICIAGRTLEDLQPNALFDVITIIDVIEHVADPVGLLDQAAVHLSPGGSLIIATGDPEYLLWRRVFRSRFWYSGFPEHITFPSLKALNVWGQRHGLQPPVAVPVRYWPLPLWMTTAYLSQMAVFLISPNLLNIVGRSVERLRGAAPPRRRCFSPGAPGVFTDHQVVSFIRPAI